MALSSDVIGTIYNAAVLGQDLLDTGLEVTEEVQSVYDEIVAEIIAAPEGVEAEPLFDWTGNKYDALIEATEAAWGAPMTLDQADMEKATLVSKSVDERRFTLGPMYVPNRIDAHAEWTDPDELQKAVWEYVRKGDRRIRLQHNRDVVAGEFVEIMAWPYEVEVPMMMKDASTIPMKFPANTVFLGVQWEPWAWELVKANKLRGYSIGGKAERLLADLPEE